MAVTEIICLANSRKGPDGSCFAGVDRQTGEWIRPIGSGWKGAVLKSEQALESGALPRVLDRIQVPLDRRQPRAGQPENWKLADGEWRQVGRLNKRAALELLNDLAETGPILGMQGKALTEDSMKRLTSSLAIIEPPQIAWEKAETGGLYAKFSHAGRDLRLKVTDPEWEAEFADDEPATYTWRQDARNFLVVSVTAQASDGWHTKLVATVISLDI